MEKRRLKHESFKDSVLNGTSNSHVSNERTIVIGNMDKHGDSEGSVKKKKDPKYKTQSSMEKPSSSDGKYKGKKKKSYTSVEETAYCMSDSPKHNKTSKKHLTQEMNIEYSDLLVKMNSSDNMRKTPKQNRRASVPNEPLELKSYNNIQVNQSPSSSKNLDKTPKRDSKYRSKTPDTKGGAGYSGRKGVSAKKSIKFEPYIPLFQVQQGLKRGEFIEGALRINPRNYEDAYVSSPDGKMDIYIGGMQNRNRALNGDIVVVQINPKQEWKVLCDAIKDYQEKSGATFADTVCEPILPSSPCKVHTPDPFVRPRPVSSSSWDSARGARSSDTLEILGIDKIAKQFESFSIKQKTHVKSKSKRKSKNTKHGKDSSSQKSSTASYSQESSEDCLDKMSPRQYSDKDIKGATVLQVGGSDDHQTISITEGHMNGLSSEKIPVDQPYPPCDMREIGEFHVETETNPNDNKWIDNENSVNIVVSPEELLQIDGNSLLSNSNYNIDELVNDSSSDIDGIVVAPEDLSGDEFTDSASVGSSYSDHLEKVLEDSAFLACQQDAENNNFELIPQHVEIVSSYTNYDSVVTLQTSSISTENSLDTQCKMQYNKSVSPIASFDMNQKDASVICSTVSDIFPKDSSFKENIVLQQVNVSDFQATPNINDNNNQFNETVGTKKPRHRRRKKKSGSAKNKAISDDADILIKVENNIQSLTVEQVMQHPEWSKFIQKTGKVVHILERKHSRFAAGHLKLLPDKNFKWALFSPNDSRVPRILIPMSDCPLNFYYRSFDYSSVLFIAEIVKWEEHCNFASGRLIKELGKMGDIEVETEGILVENGVDFQDFEDEVLDCLPKNEDWIPTDFEIKSRRDFRNQCVFTIDPASARDMDDAVSCTILQNGNYEVGVHIADVTYFVPEGTELDTVAKERATSVYLVQKVVPMLPRKLCDDLCSLKPGKDRLTYSVVWEMSPTGEILKEWIGRSMINSCIKLSYQHAQDMIENPERTWDKSEHPELFGNFSIYDVIKRVYELHMLAVKLREKRFLDGALRLDQVKLEFTLDAETGLPSGFNVYVQKDSNKLIEEFMLLANMAVATKIYKTFPFLSLLRRHPPPQSKPMQDVVSTCESMGIVLDATSSGSLQNSIARYKSDDYFSSSMVQVLMNICSKPMNCALYFCTGVVDDVGLYRHYALNVPLYTHFTSPIRRYPDIIVHRLLGAALNYNSLPDMTAVEMERCAVHCNDKKYSAKKVSELSAELFLAAFIRNLGSVHTKAMVVGVMDHSFDCLILDMGIIKRVYCDKLPLMQKEYKRSHGVSLLNLTWKDNKFKEGIKQAIIMFRFVNVVMTVGEDALQIKVALLKPEN